MLYCDLLGSFLISFQHISGRILIHAHTSHTINISNNIVPQITSRVNYYLKIKGNSWKPGRNACEPTPIAGCQGWQLEGLRRSAARGQGDRLGVDRAACRAGEARPRLRDSRSFRATTIRAGLMDCLSCNDKWTRRCGTWARVSGAPGGSYR